MIDWACEFVGGRIAALVGKESCLDETVVGCIVFVTVVVAGGAVFAVVDVVVVDKSVAVACVADIGGVGFVVVLGVVRFVFVMEKVGYT